MWAQGSHRLGNLLLPLGQSAGHKSKAVHRLPEEASDTGRSAADGKGLLTAAHSWRWTYKNLLCVLITHDAADISVLGLKELLETTGNMLRQAESFAWTAFQLGMC